MTNKKPERLKVKSKAVEAGKVKYVLQLFVTGLLPNSARAIKNINAICEQYLKGRYDLEIIDIYQQPSLAKTEDIIVVPILIKKIPLPEVRLIGDLSNVEKVLNELDLL